MAYFHIWKGSLSRDGNTTAFSFFPFPVTFLSFFDKSFSEKKFEEIN